MVNTISVVMYKDMGMDNGKLALLTSLLSLPWVVKPFWSPFVDIIKSKRWWITLMQAIVAVCVGLIAASVSLNVTALTLVLFSLVGFASATHDIAADGFYMLGLSSRSQSAFIGVRNTFYRIAMIFGQGVLVMLAGYLERCSVPVPLSWTITLAVSAVLMAAFAIYHFRVLPHPSEDSEKTSRSAGEIISEFARSFKTFFTRPGIWFAMAFLLLYRLPEALSVKMLYPLFKDSLEEGGLAMGAEQYGLVYGTFGVAALLLGGILGGLASSKWGLRKMLVPMALSLALPCSVYLYMALFQPSSLLLVGVLISLDQLGYGFGFTAYTLFMMYFSQGEFKTSHYAICTAFMALSMTLPGLVAGYLQQSLGYVGFFWVVMACCIATFVVAGMASRRVDSSFGK